MILKYKTVIIHVQ